VLFEFNLAHSSENDTHSQALQSMEEMSKRSLSFAEQFYAETGAMDPATYSPYLPYSYCQAAVVQYRLWRKKGDIAYKERHDWLKQVLREFGKRWMVASKSLQLNSRMPDCKLNNDPTGKYVEYLENLQEEWPSIAPPLG
jgi:hypothetical protein